MLINFANLHFFELLFVIFSYFLYLCVVFLIYSNMEPLERNMREDLVLNAAAQRVLDDLLDQCHLHPDARRLWSALELSGGGRLYLEYRRAQQ